MHVAMSVQAQSGSVADLEQISEMTGLTASAEAVSPDCAFSDLYQVYLCGPTAQRQRAPADPSARAAAISELIGEDGALFIPDSFNQRIMVFSAITGDLLDQAFIELDEVATGTVIHAILSSSETVLISDQTRNVVHEYRLDGEYLGVFAPAGGADTAIMQNIRGIALRPNGHLLVSVAGGGNADSIAEFDLNGNFVGNFVGNASGGLASPFDVYERPNVDWLVSSINSNQVLNYQWATGAPIGIFAPISSFPQQIHEIGNGNILVGNFSGTPGVYEFESDGTPVGVYNPEGISNYRGVFELPNGNILTATSGGVFEIDREGNLVETKFTGQSRFIQFVALRPDSVFADRFEVD